jgi:hypothetical protein
MLNNLVVFTKGRWPSLKIKVCIIILTLISILYACETKPLLWPVNNSLQEIVTYELNISDSSLILTNQKGLFKILDLTDSLVSKRDTISYNSPDIKTVEFYPNMNINSTKTYYSNPSVTEYYLFKNGSVLLAGYKTGDSLKPYTSFTTPLVIIPSMGVFADSTTAMQQSWSLKEKCYKKETKTKTIVRLLMSGNIMLNRQKEEFLLYELIITGDGSVYYGEKELLIPNAVLLESKLLFGKTKGLLYEWSIKTKKNNVDQKNPTQHSQIRNYIELTKYKKIKD